MGYILSYIVGAITGLPIFMVLFYFVSALFHKIIGDYDDWYRAKNRHRGY